MIYIKKHRNIFQVKADGFSARDLFELDRKAARLAMDRYHDHIDQLYNNSPAELADTITWLVLPRGDKAVNWFRGYFLHAQVKILLSQDPQPVYRCCNVDPSIDSMLACLCEEQDVEYHPISDNRYKKSPPHFRSALDAFESQFPKYYSILLHFRRWLIFFLYIVLRPIILNLYKIVRERIKVRFWVHPSLPDQKRFYNAPTELNSENRKAGYACYNFAAISSLQGFVLSAFAKVRRAFDHNQPIPVEWYTNPEDFRRAIELTPHVTDVTRRAGKRAREQSNSPDFTFLARQLQTVSTEFIFQTILLERAIKGFAVTVDDEIWAHTQNLTKIFPRLLSIIGKQEDIVTVAVANHYYSGTRMTDHFTENEVEGRAAVILPDLFVVWEDRSANTLREQGIPKEKIAIARDKMKAEAHAIEENYTIDAPPTSSTSLSNSNNEGNPIRVFVPLQETSDDVGLSNALDCVTNTLSNVKFVIKPHPYFTPHESLMDDIEDSDNMVMATDLSLAKIIESCDLCVSIYSTATFPALARAKPVVWIPFASPGHFCMDLLNEVGIQTDDPQDLVNALARLTQDETFYEEQARECAEFAERELVPEADAPSLANVLTEVGSGR